MVEQTDDSAGMPFDTSNSKPFVEEHIVDKKGAAIAVIWFCALMVIAIVAIRGGVLK